MKKIFISLFLAGFMFANAPLLRADDADGGLPGYFMNLGIGTRALGMGRAYVAVADDSSAVYWNPAGLALLERSEFNFTYFNLFSGTSYTDFAFSKSTARNFNYGMGMIRLFCGGIEVRDEYNVGDLATINDDNLAFFFSGAYRCSGEFSIGTNLKLINKMFDSSAQNWLAVDLSGLYLFSDKLSLGLNLQNFIQYQSGAQYSDNTLPLNIKAGVAYKLIDNRLTLALDADKTTGRSPKLHAGVEFSVNKMFTVRGGIDQENPVAGLGFNLKDFSIDFAIMNHPLGINHRESFIYMFGAPAPADPTVNAIQPASQPPQAASKFEVEANTMKEIPLAIYHLFPMDNLSVISARVKNNTRRSAKIRVVYNISLNNTKEQKEFILPAGMTHTVGLAPALDQETIRSIQALPTLASLFVEVDKVNDDGSVEQLLSEFRSTALLPYDQYNPQVPETIVAWVTPNDRALEEVITKTAAKGAALNPPVQLSGDTTSLDIQAQAKLLYDTLKDDYRVIFINQTAAYNDTQRVKLPSATLKSGGNSLELSVLFASLLESINIDPVIVMLPGQNHAIAGWKTYDEGKETLNLLETTAFGESFDSVLAKGKALDQNGAAMFDVKQIRTRIPPSPYIPR
ncbi:MAG: hypothetical protein A2297_03435 [Elusimicrobia bacterium RIFOXYB2_FULL_48_7]|nr:MAG: hypothetical protein A2297_03435 [Elusimicrobia bacterium RIFOXYB2_FULL_48_7]